MTPNKKPKTRTGSKKTKTIKWIGPDRATIQRFLENRDLTLLLADGLDEAFLGYIEDEEHPRAVYSVEKCIEILSRDMDPESAWEYFDYNVTGAYVGEQTPIFINTIP